MRYSPIEKRYAPIEMRYAPIKMEEKNKTKNK